MTDAMPKVADIDLPWNRVKRVGPEAIKDADLLAIVLRNGCGGYRALVLSSDILEKTPQETLFGMDRDQLVRIKDISSSRADILIAAFELARRALKKGVGIMPTISRPCDVLPLISDIKDKRKEHFVAIFLNARNQVICREDVSVGSLNASLVHPREVFAPAIGSSAASVILAHNYPSSEVAPSREDIELMRRMVKAREILGIEVLDHIIVGAVLGASYGREGIPPRWIDGLAGRTSHNDDGRVFDL